MKLAELLSVMSKDEVVLVANEGHGIYGQHLIYNSVSKIVDVFLPTLPI